MTARLSVRGLTRVFAGGAGVREVDLDVAAGEIHALIGLNGAGKSTLMRTLLGMLRPDAGEVRIEGVPLASVPSRVWARVGHLIEFPFAYGELSTRDNLLVCAHLRGLCGASAARTVETALHDWKIASFAQVQARRLSCGNLQRLALASALQHDPALIVLDEPSNALDPRGVVLLREALRRRAAAGAAVLVSSHHLDEVARIADRITVVNAGRVVGALEPHGAELERAFFALVLADDAQREPA